MGTQMIRCSEVCTGKVCGLGSLRELLNVAVQVSSINGYAPTRTVLSLVIMVCFLGTWSNAQVLDLSKESLIEITRDWKGDRFPDGRPKVPDQVLERMKKVALEEAWSVLRGNGYHHQFEGSLVNIHPERVLVGRAVTASYVPTRPDLQNYVSEKGERDGRIGEGATNSWVIDTLVEGDVMCINLFGKVIQGTFTGGNLANATKSNGANGMVIDGGIRDLDDTYDIEDFNLFVRGYDPSGWGRSVDLVNLNGPTRIGRATVMPGDVVLGRRGGVIFIPAHLAENVVKTSEVVRLRDDFGYQRMAEGKYTPGQIDTRWTEEIESDFLQWLDDHLDEIYISKDEIQHYLKHRTW